MDNCIVEDLFTSFVSYYIPNYFFLLVRLRGKIIKLLNSYMFLLRTMAKYSICT